MSRGKIIFIASVILIAVAAMLALREYLMLKRIQDTFRMPAATAETRNPATAASAPAEPVKMVYGVKRSGDSVSARARFSAFKKAVETRPEVLRTWGSLGWKILEDIPALCIRHLGDEAPFRTLGVVQGECITHIDGETVNQPMRNLGIWLTLGARSSIRIDTLRDGRKISYHLTKG